MNDVIIWTPDDCCELNEILKRLRNLSFRVYVASFNELEEINLFIDNSIYSGVKDINDFISEREKK